ncbi:hypothetical protein N7488_002202 [Penicillium malachiteum]|nr:hypothetical protein N7488_002202 [Penicillium malachiteum]
MLHSRLRPLPHRPVVPVADSHESFSDEEAPEDHFEAFLAHLFPDDVSSFHGVPGEHLLYSSRRYGDLDIMLQAHFLWGAGMIVAESVESADVPNSALSDAATESEDSISNSTWERNIWSARGEHLLEFGAGAALPSVICALANASSFLAIPISELVGSGNSQGPEISIHPHQWVILSDSFAIENKARFTRIIAADCYWMPLQHNNLCQSLQWFLAPGGKIWMTASFHMGRPILVDFFEKAKKYGFVVQCIWERDLIGEDGKVELRRDWVPFRENEGPENRKRWCVVAVLKRENE